MPLLGLLLMLHSSKTFNFLLELYNFVSAFHQAQLKVHAGGICAEARGSVGSRNTWFWKDDGESEMEKAADAADKSVLFFFLSAVSLTIFKLNIF